jgi:hypothetical protein
MHHVKLSVGRSFSDCTPTKGIYKGNARQNLSVYVSVGYEDGLRYEDTSIVQMETESFSPNLISTAGPENHQHQQ